jgi:hypothetical protein
MSEKWFGVVFLSLVLVAGCGGGAPAEESPTSAPEGTEPVAQAPTLASPDAEAAPSPASNEAPRTRTAPQAQPSPSGARAEDAPARAVAPVEVPAPRFREVAAPVGAELALELTSALSTETAQVESPVTARLVEAVVVDGVTVLPVGATVYGHVTEVERPGRVRGRAHLVIRFTEVGIGDERDSIRTNGLTFEGETSTRADVTKVGAGAGIGAVVGGLLGGGSGAAKGAAIGGAAGAGAVAATRGSDIVLATGTAITATLASPYEIQVEIR